MEGQGRPLLYDAEGRAVGRLASDGPGQHAIATLDAEPEGIGPFPSLIGEQTQGQPIPDQRARDDPIPVAQVACQARRHRPWTESAMASSAKAMS